MKHIKLIPLGLVLTLLMGCSTTAEDITKQDVTESVSADVTELETVEEEAPEVVTSSTGVDYDLSIMSDTMMIAQVYTLLSYPDDYDGTTFRIAGTYTYYTYPETGTYYFIVVNDAAGCCSQGIGIRFPDDIEPPDTFCNVILEGVVSLDVYEEYTMVFLDVTSIEPA